MGDICPKPPSSNADIEDHGPTYCMAGLESSTRMKGLPNTSLSMVGVLTGQRSQVSRIDPLMNIHIIWKWNSPSNSNFVLLPTVYEDCNVGSDTKWWWMLQRRLRFVLGIRICGGSTYPNTSTLYYHCGHTQSRLTVEGIYGSLIVRRAHLASVEQAMAVRSSQQRRIR